MSDEGVLHLGRIRRVSTFTREDRADLEKVNSGVSALEISEAILTQEKYGLSVIFHEDTIEWEAVDPAGRYRARGNTPCAAIILWDMEREEIEEQERPPADEP